MRPRPAAQGAQDVPLVAALSRTDIEVTTGFTGASLVVFGSTEPPIGPGGDEILVIARGPTRPVVVRRKVSVAGLIWVNGPAARFAQVPGYYVDLRHPPGLADPAGGGAAAARARPRQPAAGQHRRPVAGLPRRAAGTRDATPASGSRIASRWRSPGRRLFYVRLPLPAAVPTGDYRVEVLLVRSRRIVARQELGFRVDRVGTADRIATVAQSQPLLYGLACIAARRPGRVAGQRPVPEGLMAETAAEQAATAKRDRVFLVVVDDSAEREVALKYACLRARNGGGRVALLRVLEPVGMIEWAGVGVLMAEERREEAEKLLSGLGAQVQEITGGLPILLIREGEARDELLALLEEDPRISILVLASAPTGSGPGPLISALTGRYAGARPGADDDRAGRAGRQGAGAGHLRLPRPSHPGCLQARPAERPVATGPEPDQIGLDWRGMRSAPLTHPASTLVLSRDRGFRRFRLRPSRPEVNNARTRAMFIETEGTPNPATLKFLPGREVMGDRGTADFASAEAAARSPLAARIFALPGVARVFLGSDFVTVTEDGENGWLGLRAQVLAAIMDHFVAGLPVLEGAGRRARTARTISTRPMPRWWSRSRNCSTPASARRWPATAATSSSAASARAW